MTKQLSNYFKLLLFIAFYFFVLLIIKVDFIKIYYFNFFIIGFIILSIPLFIKDFSNPNTSLSFYVFFYSLLFFSIDLYKGFDMTDELFSFNLAYFLPEGDQILWSNPVSYFIAHYLIILPGKAYLLWERIVGASIGASILLLGYLSGLKFTKLNNSKNKIYTLVVLIGALGGIYTSIRFLIPYDMIPVLLLLLYTYIFILYKETNKTFFLFILGFLFILTIYSRATIWPFVLFITLLFSFKIKINFKIFLFYFFGILIAIFLLLILKINLSAPFLIFKHQSLSEICFSAANEHNISKIIKLYFAEGKYIFYIMFITTIAVFILNKIGDYLLKKYSKNIYFIFQIFIIILAVFIFQIFDYQNNAIFLREHFVFASKLWFFIPFALLLSLIFNDFIFEKKIDWFDTALILSLLLASFIGSNIGFSKIISTGMFSGLLFFFIFRFSNKIHTVIIFSMLILIFAFGMSQRIKKRYRDYYNPSNYAYFKIENLRGIKTSKNKVLIVENFYNKLKDYHIQDYIAANKSFIFPLLLNKKPCQLCWFVNPKHLLYSINKYSKPEFVIFSNRSMRYYYWDRKNFNKLAIPRDLRLVEKNKKILDSLYSPVLRSPYNVFVLYKLKKM
jgi:hypothetical protein